MTVIAGRLKGNDKEQEFVLSLFRRPDLIALCFLLEKSYMLFMDFTRNKVNIPFSQYIIREDI
ncbi:hypothetical protein NEIFL0001_1262 [Neisseria flavescens SK114]|nr:hypothetical protein NEIFL0001_1262 [Neisseria flavescens SK114]